MKHMKKALIIAMSVCLMAFGANFAMAQSGTYTDFDQAENWSMNNEGYASGGGSAYRGNSGHLFDSNFVGAGQQDGDTVAGGFAEQSGYVAYDVRAKGQDGGEVSGYAKSKGTQAASGYANESIAVMFGGSFNKRQDTATSYQLDGAGHLHAKAELVVVIPLPLP